MWWLAGAMFLGNAAASLQGYKFAKIRADEIEELARIKEAQTEEVFAKLERNKIRIQKRAVDLSGRQQAALAKGGIQLGTGSALTIMEDTFAFAEEQTLELEREATLINKRLKLEALNLERAATAERGAAKTRLLTGLIGGLGSFAAPLARK